MIRPATFGDLPRLYDLFEEMRQASVYKDCAETDRDTLRSLLMDSVRRNGGKNNGGTLFLVHEVDGEIQGFLLGILERVYHFLNRLRATDVFLYCSDGAQMRASSLMLDRYVAWAVENPKVIEVMLSWTDAISETAERIENAYRRRGFRKCGGIWTRRTWH